MKSIYLLILLFVAISTSMIAQPIMEFDCGKEYDWGNVKPKDSPLKAKVKIMNKGNEVLKITNVKPSCGCTTAPIDKDEIKPGEFATLDITFNIKDNPGIQRKSITISTNIPDNEKEILSIKCNVKTGYEIMPSRFNFFNSELNKESIAKVVFTNTSAENVKITNIESKPEKFIVTGIKVGQEIKSGESIAIEGKFTPLTPENFYPDLAITFEGSPDFSIIRINGNGRVNMENKAITPNEKKPEINQEKREEMLKKIKEKKNLNPKSEPINEAPKTEKK